jgi:glycosyltransferase involved in cell wall biosynthesis
MKPTVVHVITGLKTGGAEQMLSRITALHAGSAFRHSVICLTDEGPVADTIRAQGVPVRNLAMARGLPNPVAIARLARTIRAERAAVVQTWLYHADLVGGIAARLAHVPVAWGIHHSKLDTASATRSLRLTVAASARVSGIVPAAIVLVGEASRAAHIAHGYRADRMVVIPNGFDVAQFRPDPIARAAIRRELGVGDDAFLIGIAGRFVALKNHRMFVEACAEVGRNYPHAQFLMAGDGLDPSNPELTGWIDATGLADRYHPIGRRSDMPRILAALDLCVLTSRTEAFPLVIGEAMATGVPCVATDVGDTAFLIDGAGEVVPSEDVTAMAAAIERIVAMPTAERRAVGERGRQRMVDHFDIHVVAGHYDALWSRLVAEKPPLG